VTRLLMGLAFSLGLIAVVVAGAELFTGNNLIIMAYASGKIKLSALLRNWTIVWTGNLVGSILTALVMFLQQAVSPLAAGRIGPSTPLNIAQLQMPASGFSRPSVWASCATPWFCLAVWLCFLGAVHDRQRSWRSSSPSPALWAAGFEHSGCQHVLSSRSACSSRIFVPADSTFWAAIGKTAADFGNLTWGALLPQEPAAGHHRQHHRRRPALSALVYWFAYLRPQRKVAVPAGAPRKVLVVDDDPDFCGGDQDDPDQGRLPGHNCRQRR